MLLVGSGLTDFQDIGRSSKTKLILNPQRAKAGPETVLPFFFSKTFLMLAFDS